MSEYDWKVNALYEIAMSDRILISAESNVGKTWLCYNYISSILNEYRDKNIVYVTNHRTKSIIMNILKMDNMNEGGLLQVNTYTLKTKKHTNLVISSPNGMFMRGMSVDYLILDDFNKYNKEDFEDLLVYAHGNCKIIGISTDDGSEMFRYMFEDNPLNCMRLKI
jgi:hypothetical protein